MPAVERRGFQQARPRLPQVRERLETDSLRILPRTECESDQMQNSIFEGEVENRG